MNIQYTSRSKNTKTGDVPTAFAGSTYKETCASCQGCPLFNAEQPGKSNCYSHSGTGAMSAKSVFRAVARGKKYDIITALKSKHKDAKMVRFTAIGDPARADRSRLLADMMTVKAQGLDVVGYTHFWQDNPDLAGKLMASCESTAQVIKAISMGFRATVVVSWDHLVKGGGRRFKVGDHTAIVCPAQIEGARVTCNECRLCDGSKSGPVIAFLDHSPKATTERKRYERTVELTKDQAAEYISNKWGSNS